MTTIPRIKTERLILRALTTADAPALHLLMSDPEVMRYFPRPDPPPLERVQTFIIRQRGHWKKHGFGHWAVILKDSGTLMGWCGLQFLEDTNETEVAYLLGRSYWGKGYATECARASLNFARRVKAADAIVGLTHVDNYASQHVLEKSGLVFDFQGNYWGMECRHFTIKLAGADDNK